MTPALNALHYLKGKVALVTGASTSIEADASVAVNYRGGPRDACPEDAETVVECLLIGTFGANRHSPPYMQHRPSAAETEGEPKYQRSGAIAPQTLGIRLKHDRDPRALRRRFTRSDMPA